MYSKETNTGVRRFRKAIHVTNGSDVEKDWSVAHHHNYRQT